MIRLAAHHQVQRTAVGNILIIDIAMFVRFAVQCSALDIHVFSRIILRDNRERFAFGIFWIEPVSYFTEYRAGNFIPCIAGANRVYTAGGQHIPGRHLPNILVTAQALDSIVVCTTTDRPAPFLCKPWLA